MEHKGMKCSLVLNFETHRISICVTYLMMYKLIYCDTKKIGTNPFPDTTFKEKKLRQ